MTDIHVTTPAPSAGRRRLPGRRWLALALGLALLLAVVLAGAAFGGYQAGLNQREASWQATRSFELEHQYTLGLADLQGGHYELAVARFEYVVGLDPNYRDAGQQLALAQAGLAASTVASEATPTQPAEATATPARTPRPTESGEAAALFAQAEQRLAASDWDGVIAALTALDAVDRDYQAVRADGMLFTALRHRGVARIQGDAMEAGIFDLDTAQAFGPLDTEALNLRAWARTYLAGRSYWGLDWKRAMDIFEELSLVAPYFRDTDRRLFTAVVMYADQLVAAGDYCGAAERYERALLVRADEAVSAKLTTAQENCAAPPEPTAEGGEGEATPESP